MRIEAVGGILACTTGQVRSSPFTSSPWKGDRMRAILTLRRSSHARKTDSPEKLEIPSFLFRRNSATPNESSSIQHTNGPPIYKQLFRKSVRSLSSLKLAIADLGVIAALSAVGTVIEQGRSLAYYQDFYPSDRPILGFIDWKFIVDFGLDHLYLSPLYLTPCAILVLSLTACSYTRQVPAVKVAQRWQFYRKESDYMRLAEKNDITEEVDNARVEDLAKFLVEKGYEVFYDASNEVVYGFKGMIGKYSPIVVHISLLLILFGSSVGALCGSAGDVLVPEGRSFDVGMGMESRAGPLANTRLAGKGMQVMINDFTVDYLPSGEVDQYYSDLSVYSPYDEEELTRKTIRVNEPLRIKGVTMYQTNWGINSLQISLFENGDSSTFSLPMADLSQLEKSPFSEANSMKSGRSWGTFLPLSDSPSTSTGRPKGIVFIAKDFQSVVIYDSEGRFAGIRRPGSGKPITVDGLGFQVDNITGSSGLLVKQDPGVPYVYAGFGALIISSFLSFVSHSQVWACQDRQRLLVTGRSTKDSIFFLDEMSGILDDLPEAFNTPP